MDKFISGLKGWCEMGGEIDNGTGESKGSFVIIKESGDDARYHQARVIHGVFRSLKDAEVYAEEWDKTLSDYEWLEIHNIHGYSQEFFDNAEHDHYDQLALSFGEESNLVIG